MQKNFNSTANIESTAQGIVNNDNDCFIISALQLFARSGLLRTMGKPKWSARFIDQVNPIVAELINLRREYEERKIREDEPLKVQNLRNALASQKNIYQNGSQGDAWDITSFIFGIIHDYYFKSLNTEREEACCPVHKIFGKVGKQVEICTNERCTVFINPKIDDIDIKAYTIRHSVQMDDQENWLVSLGIINKGENEDRSILTNMDYVNTLRRCHTCHQMSYKKAFFFSEFPRYLLLHLGFSESIPNLPSTVYSNFEKFQSIPCGAYWYNAVGFVLYVRKEHYTAIIYSRAKKVWQVIDDQRKILLEDYNDLKETLPYIALYRLSNKKSTYHFPIFSRNIDLPIEPNYIAPPDSVNLEQTSTYIPTKQFVDRKICLSCSMPNPIYNYACISCRVIFNNPSSS